MILGCVCWIVRKLFDDVRVCAVVLAVGGIACALLLPLYALGITTALMLVALDVGIESIEKIWGPSNGTSGNMGLAFMMIGASGNFLLPMWIAFGVRCVAHWLR